MLTCTYLPVTLKCHPRLRKKARSKMNIDTRAKFSKLPGDEAKERAREAAAKMQAFWFGKFAKAAWWHSGKLLV